MVFLLSTHVSFPRSWLHAGSTINSRPFRLCTLALLLVVTLLDVSYAAEQRTSPPPTAAAEMSPLAPVTLDGQVLFKVRGLSAFPAEQRASLIEERLRGIASNTSLPLDSLRVEERTDRSLVKFSDELVVMVFEADAEIEGISRQLLAETYQNRIRTGVDAYRRDRNPQILYTHALYAVGATAAFSLSVYLLALAFRRLDQLLEKRYKSESGGPARQDLPDRGIGGDLERYPSVEKALTNVSHPRTVFRLQPVRSRPVSLDENALDETPVAGA
jgi:hypothetical protein